MKRDDLRGWLLDTDASMPARFVFVALTLHANPKSGLAYPSITHLATETGMGRRTVQRALGELEQRGDITASRRRGVLNAYRVVHNERQNGTSAAEALVPESHELVPLTTPTSATVAREGIEGIEGARAAAEVVERELQAAREDLRTARRRNG